MADNQPPEEPRGSDPHHEPHGVVEAIREEIEEVVEHVPEPVRWTVRKIALLVVLSIIGLLVLAIVSVALYFMNRTELVAREITLVLNQTLASRSDVVLRIGDVKGNPLTGVRVLAPHLEYKDGTPLLDAPEMRVSYPAVGLLTGGRGPIEVTIVRPVVRLDVGPNGGWRFPKWMAAPRTARAARELDLRLHLVDAQIHAPRPMHVFQGFDLDVNASTGPTTVMELERLRWKNGPWDTQLEGLRGRFVSSPDSTIFRLEEFRTRHLVFRANGAWAKRDSVQRMHADVTQVRWSWLAKVFANETFKVPGEGRIVLDVQHGAIWQGRFSTNVIWDSLAAKGTGRFSWNGHQLAIDSLDAKSLAGNLRGNVRWSPQGWVIGGDAQGADPSHWQALRLRGWPAGQLNGRFRYSVDTRKLSVARLDARLRGSQWSGWVVDSAVVRVDFPPVARDSFAVVGYRRGGVFTLRARVEPDRWSGPFTLRDFPLEEWPDGRLSGLRGILRAGSGMVENRAGALFVTGMLEGESTTWSAAQFAHWRLSDIQGKLLPVPDMTARLHAEDGFFTGIHLDSTNASLRLGDQSVVFGPAEAAAGDTLFTLAGNATWVREQWRMLLTSASATSTQFAWTAEPPVRIHGDRDGVVFERMLVDDGPAHLEATGRWAAPSGYYDFSMQAHDLDVGRLGMPSDWGLAGRADAHLLVSGRSGDPRWTFEGRSAKPAFGGHAADSLSFSLGGAMHRLEVRDFQYQLGGGSLRGAGQIDRTVHPWPDSLTGTAVLRWLQDAGHWEGQAHASHFPIERLEAIAPQAAGWGGTLDGTLKIQGSPASPVLELDASADRFGWQGYRAERVETQARYHDGVLEVPETRIRMLEVLSTIRGRMPLQLALGRLPVIADSPMSWRIEVPKGDLQLLPLLVPQIQSARGQFELLATVEGTPKKPKMQGGGRIRDGTIRPINREEELVQVYADLHFNESRISLDTLSARQGRTGRIRSKGEVNLSGAGLENYRFDLELRDFAASEEGTYAMLFDGDFVVTDGSRVYGDRLPHVTGDVRVKKGSVEFDFANQSEVQRRAATTQPLYWTYRIHMAATSNLRWNPPDGDMEFSADLDLEQTPDAFIIYGEMHSLRGTYYFLSNRFTVTQADLIFDNQRGVDPTLDVTAQTKLRPYRPDLATAGLRTGGGADLETIVAHITGRSSQPVITLSSLESSWGQRQILGELTYGRFSDQGGSGNISLTDPLDNYLTRQLNNQLSQNMSEFFRGAITEWNVERERGGLLQGTGDLVFGVGTYLTPQLAVRYRQRLSGFGRTGPLGAADIFERDVEAEYRINRFIFLTTEVAKRRNLQGPNANEVVNDVNVNLKARWEY
ncbi:MAG: translocation/assembly module TamB domain-containing protein [Candidatus Eisenbacteria bacterium]